MSKNHCHRINISHINIPPKIKYGFDSSSKRLRLQLIQVDLRLRILTVPGVQEEVRRDGVETEKNRDKSSNCDVYVTCDDVRCFL